MSDGRPDTWPDETIEELYDRAPCGYVTSTIDGMIVRINETLCDWLGYAEAELIGNVRLQDLLTVAGKVYFDTHVVPHLSLKGEVGEVAFDLVCKDGGALPVLVHVRRDGDERGGPPLYRFTIFNAKERRRYERELLFARREAERATTALKQLNETLEQRVEEEVKQRLKAEASLRQSQKMEALGQLTGGVAHDFNNLLTVIIGGLDTIVRQLNTMPVDPKSARQRRAADMALQGAQAAAALTHRLLAFSRQQPLAPKSVDLNQCVSGTSELLRRTLGEAIELGTVLAAGVWHTKIDANQFENALLNLAVNARDAMPGGGHLTIETSNTCLDETYVSQLRLQIPPGQYVCVAVTDTGTGMDPQTLERVFEPFFTTKDPGKGTGLGLSQVYGFVRQSGGNVKIYSELGRGTTVKIYLPRHLTPPAESDEPAHHSLYVSTAAETILVVEDNDMVREHARHVLEELGYVVLEAADAKTALDLVNSDHEVDLLFTDLVLRGGSSGSELAQAVRAVRPAIKVLFTTGFGRNAMVQDQDWPFGSAFIGKPYSTTSLARDVRRVLDA